MTRLGVVAFVGRIACACACACSTATMQAPPTTEPSPVAAAPAVSLTPAPAARAEVPMSDPAEYDIARISRDAGKAIFTRTGVGDPYRTGVPYPMFLALMRGYPQLFGHDPQELARTYGFVARVADPASKDADLRAGLPLGMHLTTDPITHVPFVVTNCSLCHAEHLRWPGGEATVIGLGNKRVRVHDYDAAFAELTRAPRFGADHLGKLADEAAAANHVEWPAQFRDAIVGATVAALAQRARDRGEFLAHVAHGAPGRVATMEAFALTLSQLTGRTVAYAPVVGWAKVPDVIGFAVRTTLSWDGSGEGSMDLLAVEADVAAGVRPAWMLKHPFQGASLGAYLRQPEPRPAFPGKIDRALAERGRKLFGDRCASCHGTYRDGRAVAYDEQVVAVADLGGVDPARVQAATEGFERAANDPALTLGYTKFQRSDGYVPPILTNVWARAPYGHAGQWPSLAVMATPPAARGKQIVVDLDAPYDLAAVGVATRAPDARALRDGEFVDDATQPGMTNGGHPFLADLGKDSAAVIEYLKTL